MDVDIVSFSFKKVPLNLTFAQEREGVEVHTLVPRLVHTVDKVFILSEWKNLMFNKLLKVLKNGDNSG